ncbi:hypothetical protein P8452_26984 [Trifolium repens]|nr:hypothetical protein P8452_26984 [Trifolium repens]
MVELKSFLVFCCFAFAFVVAHGLATNETTKDDAARVLEMLRNRLEEVMPQVVAFCWKVEIGHIPTCWNLLKRVESEKYQGTEGPISESSNGVSKLVCKSCMEMSEAQTSSQLQTAATCSKSIPPVVQPRSPETVVVPESLIKH